MDIVVSQKQLSNDEKLQIDKQVKEELIDHLYKGCLPGTIGGSAASIAVFLDYYGYAPIKVLISWFVTYNLMLVLMTVLYFFYIKYKNKTDLRFWETSYSTMMLICCLLWVPMIYNLPADITRQFLALLALFMITTGYATGTIGQFKLCMATLFIMLIPIITWCLFKDAVYLLVAFYSVIYLGFMSGANHRSTQWFKDSLKLKIENTLVSYQANHDLLTDLPNQRLLPQYIESATQSVVNTEHTFALVSFSLNRMEIINDTLGHQAGDEIIKSVAIRLNALATKMAKIKNQTTHYILTISRKDTFVILLAPLKPEEAEAKAKLLFSVLDDSFYLEKKGVKITASIGVSIFGKDGTDAQSLLANADTAMLQAKHFGGNHLEFYRDEINGNTPKLLELETDLHAAIKNNELLVFYQPLIDLKTSKICGMEALLRWRHPVHGLISPANFIPLAEETGLIVPIGEWVLHEACKQTRLWHEMGFTSLKVAVNLSEKQLRQKSIIATIQNILKKTSFDPLFLELEITETAILDETIIHLIAEFKKLGLSLAVDDFGTGYSGLSYLKRFSIDKIKIDQSFIRDIPTSNDSMTIVSAIIAMAKELKVNTLAEGVETEEQLQFLKTKGCDFVQGYYFSKPVDTDFFTQLLTSHRINT